MATIKLEAITTEYRSFVNDQVLTAEQLNTIIDYFEDQNRLTRVCLGGVGIICGLDVQYIENTSISVSNGSGVTTDGDLIKYEGETYTHYRLFEDRDAVYTKFADIADILELITEEEAATTEASELSALANIADKVVVLYLENYAKEETPCTSTDCDTQGKEQVANIRILLLNKTDVVAMNTTDTVFTKHNNIEKYLNLPKAPVKRMILNQVNSKKYVDLIRSYIESINKAPSALSKLKSGIQSMFTDFDQLLQIEQGAAKWTSVSNGFDTIFKLSIINSNLLDIQYRYDLLKDIEDTYEEIKRLLFDLRMSCCPSETSFPKHLLLGELVTNKAYLICRHKFYPSIIIPHSDERLKEIRNLLDRIYYMFIEYEVNKEELIKIIPSKDYIHDLSDRSIPYYFRTTDNLLQAWDHHKTRQYNQDRNLGYQTNSLSVDDDIQNPLDYCLNKHDFYRIEGHLGRDYFEALKEINEIKTQKGLAFDVKVLSINETLDDIDITKYDCHFEDLNTILLAWLKEQKCLFKDIAEFFSGFRTDVPGINKYYQVDRFTAGITGTVLTDEVATPITRLTRNELLFDQENLRVSAQTGFQIYVPPIIYEPVEIVEESIYIDTDVIGSYINNAIEQNPDREAQTIISVIEAEVNTVEAIANLDEDTRDITIRFPYELLAYARTAARLIPTRISEINTTRLENYADAIDELCRLVDRYQKKLNSVLYGNTTTYNRRGFESRVELLLNQLGVNCCAAERIQVLLDDIQKRKEEILAQKTLAKFVEKHPGLEHKAGVKPGGTFVLVYNGRKDVGTPINTFTAINSLNLEVANFTQRIDEIGVGVTINEDIQDQIRGLLRRDESLAIRTINVAKNTVVADFSLPYLCCSDCAPINFIIPAQPVSLRLPVAFVCLNETTQPILFEVIPEDGVVRPNTDGVPDEVVALNADGRYVFDATEVPAALYGEEITFTVNDQLTDCKVAVYEMPQFSFEVDSIIYDYEQDIAQVTMSITEINVTDDINFEWSFGDGTPNSLTSETAIVHRYDLSSLDGNVVTVSLTAANGPCEHAVTIEVEFEEQPVSLLIDPDTICLGDEPVSVGFTVTPDSGTVATDVVGITIDGTANQITVDPTTFDADNFGQAITFTVNGGTTDAELIVTETPSFRIVIDLVEYDFDANIALVTMHVEGDNLSNTFSYEWAFGDGTPNLTTSDIQVDHQYDLSAIDGNVVTISLTTTNGPCGDTQTTDVTFEEPPIILIIIPDAICLGEEAVSVDFTVTPAGTSVATEVSGITIDDANNQITVDPRTFEAGNFGQQIAFTANGEATTAQLIVTETPSFGIRIDSIEYDFDSNRAFAALRVVGENLSENFSYEWTFGDGSSNETTSDITISHEYDLSSIDGNSVSVSLTATNGPCGDTQSTNITFQEQPISLIFDSDSACLGQEPLSISFGVTPIDASVATTTPGVTVDNTNNRIEIDPATFEAGNFGQSITFTVNGDTVDTQFIVGQRPEFGIVFSPDPIQVQAGTNEVEVTFSVENLNGFNEQDFGYTWNFGGDTNPNGLSVTHIFRDLGTTGQNPVLFTVGLTVGNDFCEADTITSEVPVQIIPAPDIDIRLDRSNFCENDSRSYSFIITPAGATPTIAGNGVTPQSGGGFAFVPANSNIGGVSFTVDGESSDFTAIVHRIPQTTLFYAQEGDVLVVGAQNNLDESWEFEWSFDLDTSNPNTTPMDINGNIARLGGDGIRINVAIADLRVNRNILGEASCETTISAEIIPQQIRCERQQWGTVNLLHEGLKVIRNNTGEGVFNTRNPILQALVENVFNEYAFYSSENNISSYSAENMRQTLESFNEFFRNDSQWTRQNINSPADLALFASLIQYEYILLTTVVQCAEEDVSGFLEIIQGLFTRLGIPFDNNPRLTNTTIEGTDATGLLHINVVNLADNITRGIDFNGLLNFLNRMDG